ncbi:putative proline oxidase Put1 [Emericellopsis atlantica]|uniref:Proline dehydrogenase n=1 Tax=Emericellopsis atlantica TaxID=2614577 RepID=A0A9P7ZND7_9HYPO|nr:putative proline oxidase Put1 [Emericellopsis atlantica]KAG9255304.1 putative proline oxidase Put1 [Emericellopsis atlantica]
MRVSTARKIVALPKQGADYLPLEPFAASLPRPAQRQQPRPLAKLPTSVVLRSLAVNYAMSSPLLNSVSMAVLRRAVHPTNALFDTAKNPLLRFLLRAFAYDQFCAGMSPGMVQRRISGLKDMGYRGVILCYGKETVIKGGAASAQEKIKSLMYGPQETLMVEQWKDGLLKTLSCLGAGDFLAVKVTGAGPMALDALKAGEPMPAPLQAAMDEVCALASSQGVRCWLDAEQAMLQGTIDEWAIDLMRTHNKNGVAVMSNTIQAYLKAAPANVKRHVELASKEGWTLGIKLVRGAYIDTDPRHLIHDTAQDTHDCFDEIARGLISCDIPEGGQATFPTTQLFMATHNAASVRKALTLQRERVAAGQPCALLEFGQLQGMADDVSCELLEECGHNSGPNAPGVYKYLTWGTLTECLGYLYRRSLENKGMAARAGELAGAMGNELWQRVKTLKF